MKKEKTILVVEDEKPLLGAIRISLEKHGFNVITARNVDKAKERLLEASEVNAIWIDHYLLGKESGLDFVFWCKEKTEEHNKIPIFLVSNTASSDKIKTYLAFGINKYYIKAEKRLDDIIGEIKDFLEKEEK